MRSKIACLTRVTAMALVAMAISCTLLLVFQTLFNPFHVVVSDSMAPQIKTGDAVVIKDVKPDELKVGTVVIFQDPESDGQYIIHRIVALEEAGKARLLTTKGDNNPIADDVKIPVGAVAGSMAAKLPRFGLFLNFLSSRLGYFSLIAIPGVAALLLVFLLSLIEKVEYARARRLPFNPQPTREEPLPATMRLIYP